MTLLTARAAPRPPYNAPAPLVTRTPDGYGAAVHPAVLDMRTPWRGYRYWLAYTPYHASLATLENPCIMASHDGIAWEYPPGLVNPIAPPLPAGFNSDTDLVHDPAQDRLVCYWRAMDGTRLMICASESSDGHTWSSLVELHEVPLDGARLSPAYALGDDGLWRSWWLDGGNRPCKLRTASDPLGPWSEPEDISFGGTASGGLPLWHGDVARHPDGHWLYLAQGPNLDVESKLYGAASRDGIIWSGWSLLMESRDGHWDRRLYRATFTAHPNRRDARVWYSAFDGGVDWRIGHTVIPLSAWPDPPS